MSTNTQKHTFNTPGAEITLSISERDEEILDTSNKEETDKLKDMMSKAISKKFPKNMFNIVGNSFHITSTSKSKSNITYFLNLDLTWGVVGKSSKVWRAKTLTDFMTSYCNAEQPKMSVKRAEKLYE
jgi:hypothetical protein